MLAWLRESGIRKNHRTIPEEHVEGAMVAFQIAHEACPQQMVEFHRGEWSLVCWCRWCTDLKTYQVWEELA
jgi:hypothetical protein